ERAGGDQSGIAELAPGTVEADQRGEDRGSGGEIAGAKQRPAREHEQHGERPSDGIRQWSSEPLPGRADDEPRPVPQAPGNVGPTGPGPKAAQAHGYQERRHGTGTAARDVAEHAGAAASQGNEQVVANEVRQGDVPAAPEVRDACGKIGSAEVFWQDEAEH